MPTASHQITAPGDFLDGMTVDVYPAVGQISGGKPTGQPVLSTTVAAGLIVFSALEVGVQFIAWCNAAGRGVRVMVPFPAPTAGGTGAQGPQGPVGPAGPAGALGTATTVSGTVLPSLLSGTEYVWFQTDGNGVLVDIVAGKVA